MIKSITNAITMLSPHVKKVGYYLVPEITLMNKYERWRGQAKVLKLSKEARVRLEWFIYYESKANKNTSLTARHFGIAPKTFYKWKKLFDGKNLRTLESRSKAPKHVRQKEITPEEERRVIKLRRKYIYWGKMKIAVLYEREYRKPISSWKVQYTIEKYKMYRKPQKNKQTQAKRKRNKEKKHTKDLKKQPFPGFLIAFDTIVIYWNGKKRYILTGIDEVSKIAFARMYTTKHSRNAKDFIQRMAYLLDYELWNACHDNGSEFEKEFQDAVEELKIGDYWSRVATPKDNPICERFNRTIQEEFIDLGNMTDDVVLFNKRVTEWLIEYTFVRPHQTLDYMTPWSFYQRTAKVLPMYSSRTRDCIKCVNLIYSLHFGE